MEAASLAAADAEVDEADEADEIVAAEALPRPGRRDPGRRGSRGRCRPREAMDAPAEEPSAADAEPAAEAEEPAEA